tara:strand:+ start:251 stop:487 length:237 start_codon:yes stop_codon:yes gene_type:complete
LYVAFFSGFTTGTTKKDLQAKINTTFYNEQGDKTNHYYYLIFFKAIHYISLSKSSSAPTNLHLELDGISQLLFCWIKA